MGTRGKDEPLICIAHVDDKLHSGHSLRNVPAEPEGELLAKADRVTRVPLAVDNFGFTKNHRSIGPRATFPLIRRSDLFTLFQISPNHRPCVSIKPHSPPVDPDAAVAEPLHGFEVVAHEQNRPTLVSDITHLAEALPLEGDVADCEDFVNEQDFGLKVSGHRERQPHRHAARVMFDLRVEKALDLGERHDLVELAAISARFIPRITPFRKTFSRPVSSEWKPVPTSSSDPTRPRISARAVSRLGDARENFEQCRLAGAVASDEQPTTSP